MSRLYYDKPKLTSDLQPEAFSGTDDKSLNDYLTKVAAMVPAEVIAGYLTMHGLVGAIKFKSIHSYFYWIVFAACLILTPIYINWAADEGKPKRNHIIISTIAFIVWAYTTTGVVLSATIAENIYDQAIASIILILFSMISGKIPLNK